MATKVFQLFLCIFLIFSFALPLPSHARPLKPKADENPSSFESIKHLEGSRKGQTVKGLQQLKAYLEAFGYLNYSHVKNDDFDDSMEAAVKTYQLNYHLETTGTLDAQTLSAMMAPRCGVPDIINGTNWMQAGQKGTKHTHNTVADYAFFNGNPKWPPSKYQLTYGFIPGTRSDAIAEVAKAFNTWSSQSQFKFSQSQDVASADLKIGFFRGDHGDGSPFPPNSGVLAHAFPPTDGRFHYNQDQPFSAGPVQGSFDLQTVALHEIGHLLGLAHSQVQEAIMFPGIPRATTKGLNADDIQGLKALYSQ
jgi:hypothetical protein